MKKTSNAMPKLLLALSLMLVLCVPTFAGATSLITKEELKPMLGDPDLVILDVRTGRDWKSSEFKIKGAVRAEYKDYAQFGDRFGKDKTYVLYCA